MKLDRIKFAQLIGYISPKFKFELSETDIYTLDDLTEINTMPVPTDKVDAERIDTLLKALHKGNRIEAIKEYRSLTGQGLKESKDAIEAYPMTAKIGSIKSIILNYFNTNDIGTSGQRNNHAEKLAALIEWI